MISLGYSPNPKIAFRFLNKNSKRNILAEIDFLFRIKKKNL